MNSFRITLVFLLYCYCLVADDVIYSSGIIDGKFESSSQLTENAKIKIDQSFPSKLQSGKHASVFLGKIKNKNLLIEIGLIRTHDIEMQRREIDRIVRKNNRLRKNQKNTSDLYERIPLCSFMLKYNNQRIANYVLNEPYVRLQIPIPSHWHEEQENVLTLINTGDYAFGIDYIKIKEWNFDSLKKVSLALKAPEDYPKEVRKYFHYSWYKPKDREELLANIKTSSRGGFKTFVHCKDNKSYNSLQSPGEKKRGIPVFTRLEKLSPEMLELFGKEYLCFESYPISRGTSNETMSGILLENLKKGKSETIAKPACILKFDSSIEKRFHRKNARNFLASLLAAPAHSFNTLLFNGIDYPGDYNGSLFHDRYGMRKPAYYLLPFVRQFFNAESKYLPVMILPLSGNDPIPRDIYIGASIYNDSVITILATSRYSLPAKIKLLMPWNGETIVKEFHSELPRKLNIKLKKRKISVSPYIPFIELNLPPNSFHFVQLIKNNASISPKSPKTDMLPEPEPKKYKKLRPKILPEIFDNTPPPIFTQARVATDTAEAFGSLKDQIKVTSKKATVSKINGIENVVPYKNDSTLATFSAVKQPLKKTTGVHYFVRFTGINRKGLRGLGFWIFVHSRAKISKALNFEYEDKKYIKLIKPGKWQFCFLPIKKVHSTFFSIREPSNRKKMTIELNGVNWIYDRNNSGQPNAATKCRLKKSKEKHKVFVEVQGKPKGYCEIRKRIYLDFKPNKIECENKKINLKYFPKSGIIEIKGKLPESKHKYATVLFTLFLKRNNKK